MPPTMKPEPRQIQPPKSTYDQLMERWNEEEFYTFIKIHTYRHKSTNSCVILSYMHAYWLIGLIPWKNRKMKEK
jgi:hypothetical protein